MKFIDERHGKMWQNLFVVLAAVLGGVVGSLLTIYAQNWDSPKTNTNFNRSSNESVITKLVTNADLQPISKNLQTNTFGHSNLFETTPK